MSMRSESGLTYVWRNGGIERWDRLGWPEATQAGLINLYMFDGYALTSVDLCYGMFTPRGWDHIPYVDFPKDFKLALLIMGAPAHG